MVRSVSSCVLRLDVFNRKDESWLSFHDLFVLVIADLLPPLQDRRLDKRRWMQESIAERRRYYLSIADETRYGRVMASHPGPLNSTTC